MTHITLPRETVQQISDAYELLYTDTDADKWDAKALQLFADSMDALRTALEAAPAAQKVEPDYCTDPDNCRRCKTHPNHRGDMEHAGIGRRPVAPAARESQECPHGKDVYNYCKECDQKVSAQFANGTQRDGAQLVGWVTDDCGTVAWHKDVPVEGTDLYLEAK